MHVRRHLRRRATDLLAASFELWIALAAIVTAATYVIAPELLKFSALGREVDVLGVVWSAMYAGGGLSIFYGLLRPSLRFELAGLCLLGTAAAVNAVAIYALCGPSGLGSSLTYASLLPACAMRGYLVWRLHRLVNDWPVGERRRRPR